MRLLVAPHDLGIGGSQINAIDLAAGAAKAGHDVAIYGRPGPLVDYVESNGLEFIPARGLRFRPAPSRIAQLGALARRRRLDLIHAYEWPPCLDAYYGAHLGLGVPLLCTVLSMSVSTYVPPSIPLIMGTEALAEEARARHRAPVWVLEPPIDTSADSPSLDGTAIRRAFSVSEETLLLVTVSRLALELKLDALVEAIDATAAVAGELPAEILVVGAGPAESALRSRAAQVNRHCGREVVKFAGAVSDPRNAYAAADLVLGMGSSSLRAMAIGKPVIVQGEAGFSKIFEPASHDYFLRHGFWGLGDGKPNTGNLARQIRELLTDETRRRQLGRYGLDIVSERFSLERGIRAQLDIYRSVSAAGGDPPATEPARIAARALRLELENHDPRRKRARSAAEAARLHAAAQAPPAERADPAIESLQAA
jgi:glycosyltransferase involved in cell wall biosynthesis